MKKLQRKDLFSWSAFSEKLDIDFNSFAWIRSGGNVLIDPLPLSPHDEEHLRSLGGVEWIIITNSSHVRGATEIAERFSAKLMGPLAEKENFPVPCQRWLQEGDEPFPGLRCLELAGSKTPGELAFVLDDTVLITGDLIRSHRANRLMLLLPVQGLKDKAQALSAVKRILRDYPKIDAVLVGDGFCLFENGRRHLEELAVTGE